MDVEAAMVREAATAGKHDAGPAALRQRLRAVLEATLPWALVMGIGIGFLGFVLQAGLQAHTGRERPPGLLLAELAARIETDIATGATLGRGSTLQQRLEEALAQAPALQAIDLVAPEGRVLLSTEPSAVGRPAAEGSVGVLARRPISDAAGAPLGELMVHAASVATPVSRREWLAPGTALVALALPALALLALTAWPRQALLPAEVAAAHARLGQARQRLALAALDIEQLEASGAQDTGVRSLIRPLAAPR